MKEHYLAALRKYAEFDGRSGRPEFWYFILANFLITVVLNLFGFVTGEVGNTIFAGLASLYTLAIIVPSIAVSVRRMHDIGYSGWMVLLNLIPAIGWIIFLIFAAQEGDAGSNEYGPKPGGVSGGDSSVSPEPSNEQEVDASEPPRS